MQEEEEEEARERRERIIVVGMQIYEKKKQSAFIYVCSHYTRTRFASGPVGFDPTAPSSRSMKAGKGSVILRKKKNVDKQS